MNKMKIGEVQKILDVFRDMFIKNSSEEKTSGRRELTPRGKNNENHNSNFKKVIEIILNVGRKYDEENLKRKNSFVEYRTFLSDGTEWIVTSSWKELLDKLEKSKDFRYLKFLRHLEENPGLGAKKYWTIFTLNNLNRFISDILADVEDDDNILDPAPIPINPEKEKNLTTENEEEESGEEKNELSENSEQYGKELIIKLQKEMISLLEKLIEEKEKSLKESRKQKNTQESEKLEKEISKLKEELSQKKQELEKLLLKQEQLLIK